MFLRYLVVCLVTAFLLMGCDSGPDPAVDAKRALAKGDRHLVGYTGVGIIVPGTPDGFDYLKYQPGVKVVSNVSDTSSPSDSAKADRYASRYNQVILSAPSGAP